MSYKGVHNMASSAVLVKSLALAGNLACQSSHHSNSRQSGGKLPQHVPCNELHSPVHASAGHSIPLSHLPDPTVQAVFFFSTVFSSVLKAGDGEAQCTGRVRTRQPGHHRQPVGGSGGQVGDHGSPQGEGLRQAASKVRPACWC